METIDANFTEQKKHNVGSFLRDIKLASLECGARVDTWAEIEGYPLYCIRIRGEGEIRKKIMLTADFHAGTEAAGQMAILEFLKENPLSYLKGVELTILPLVNPTGFELGTRENNLGEEVNRGYGVGENQNPLSREGIILKSHQKEIFESARDGELSLHGDENTSKGGFVYCHKNAEELSLKLLKILSTRFGVVDSEFLIENQKVEDPNNIIAQGLVVGEDDGDFGDWLHQLGIPIVIVTETPDKDRSLDERIAANLDIIREFCRY
ncbi:MAG TPA: hypothetical protein VN174_01385 [Candidatus Methanoperedens sp.]|nr:hypothetical protein [Candidatus Methanoperedens sp.]